MSVIDLLHVRQDHYDHKSHHGHHHHDDQQRIDKGAADLGQDFGVFFLLIGQPLQGFVQRTGGFAGFYQAAVDPVEDFRVTA